MITNILTSDDVVALLLSFKLAFISTMLLLLIATPVALWLAHSRFKLKVVVEAIVCLPIVLPPSVLGFYLLILFSNHGFLGEIWNSALHTHLLFSFSGLVIGSIIYSFPFVVQPLQNAFSLNGKRPFLHAKQLNATSFDRFFKVGFPLYYRSYIVAGMLGFAHTLGEFGLVLMIGGNIPGKTQLVSVDIFNHVEQFEYHQAYALSILLLVISFLMLLCAYAFGWRSRWTIEAA
jgi:molybdate transport system permease protein